MEGNKFNSFQAGSFAIRQKGRNEVEIYVAERLDFEEKEEHVVSIRCQVG